MESKKPILGMIGITAGAMALLLALIHFWGGPFAPQPSLEQTVAETAVSIRDATIAALKGEPAPVPEPKPKGYDLDQILSLVTAVLGGAAVILAVLGIAFKEPRRVAGGAAALGAGAIAFQFAAFALGAIVFVILIVAVLGALGAG